MNIIIVLQVIAIVMLLYLICKSSTRENLNTFSSNWIPYSQSDPRTLNLGYNQDKCSEDETYEPSCRLCKPNKCPDDMVWVDTLCMCGSDRPSSPNANTNV